MKYNMKLQNEPFQRMKNGTKTIELRLNDENEVLINGMVDFSIMLIVLIQFYQKFKILKGLI